MSNSKRKKAQNGKYNNIKIVKMLRSFLKTF